MSLEGRIVFDRVAALYERRRPSYPTALVEDLLEEAGVASPVLEIACGTGQMTQMLADRGCAVDAVELGENLASIAREKFADNKSIRIIRDDFEQWEGVEGKYGMAICATAFHWLDESVAVPRMARWLKPGGWIALCWNLQPLDRQEEAFTKAVDGLYAKVRRSSSSQTSYPRTTEQQIELHKARLDFPQLVEPVRVRTYPWSQSYTTEEYVELISTWSPHLLMEESQRSEFLAGMAELVDSFGGSIQRNYLSVSFCTRTRS
jgi:SAM-dependent methyltransferase